MNHLSYHQKLIKEEIKRKQYHETRRHRTSSLFLNLLAAEITGVIVGKYVGKPFKKPIDRIKNGYIKRAFKI